MYKECKFDGCERLAKCRGFCSPHYRQFMKGKELTPVGSTVGKGREKRSGAGLCIVEWCDSPDKVRGLCAKHYQACRCYNLSPGDLSALLQPGRCGLCGVYTDDLHIDHDHSCCDGPDSCGECVRGVLCRTCNIGISYMENNRENLGAVVEWMDSRAEVGEPFVVNRARKTRNRVAPEMD